MERLVLESNLLQSMAAHRWVVSRCCGAIPPPTSAPKLYLCQCAPPGSAPPPAWPCSTPGSTRLPDPSTRSSCREAAGRCEKTLEGHTGEVACLATSGGRLVSGSFDRTTNVWKMEGAVSTWRCVRTLTGNGSAVSCVATWSMAAKWRAGQRTRRSPGVGCRGGDSRADAVELAPSGAAR